MINKYYQKKTKNGTKILLMKKKIKDKESPRQI